jgi:tetratricopeptide (TPR) repeat protein
LADYNYTLGTFKAYKKDPTRANEFFLKALEFNPYHYSSRMALIKNIAKTAQKNEAIGLLQDAMQLDLPWTPAFAARAYDYINQ